MLHKSNFFLAWGFIPPYFSLFDVDIIYARAVMGEVGEADDFDRELRTW